MDVDSLPWVRDHKVAGSPVVPASAYIHAALAAARDATPFAQPVVQLELHESLRLECSAGPVRLQTIVAPEAETASFQIFSRAAGAGEWTLHATGRMEDDSQPLVSPELAAAKQRIVSEVPVAALYESLCAHQIDLGEASRNVRSLWIGDREALGEIAVNDDSDASALLDACFHVVGAAALFGQPAGAEGTYVLRSVGRYRETQPLSGRVLAHARVFTDEPGALKADLTIYDPSGAVLARTEDLRMGLLAAEAAAPRDWFYRLEWQEKALVAPTATRTGAIVDDPAQVAALAAECDRDAIAQGLDGYNILRPQFDRIAAQYVVAALRRAGVAFEPGETLLTSSLMLMAGVLERHGRFFNRLLEMLAEDGILWQSGEQWRVVRRPESESPDTACRLLEKQHPAFVAELQLIERCGSRLLEVLRGQTDPLQLLSDGGSFETLERLYIHSPAAQVFNPLAGKALDAALAAVPAGRRVRILEIGAGTGGTTTCLTPVLAGRDVEYVFTDVSALFAARARERFSGCPFMRYEVLDIERPAAAQGFSPESFDIAIAANVLHATADLRATVRNVRSLIAPSGLLVLIEGTRPERWVDLTFGMTEGWWKFNDATLRPSHALLNREQWLDLLNREGFSATAIEPASGSQQVLLLAKANEVPDRTRLRTVRVAAGYSAASDCDVLLYDATRGGSCADLVSLLQTAASQPTPPRVWLATEGVHPLTPHDAVNPEQAALWGIARTAALEFPEIWGGAVDVEPLVDPAEIVRREANSGSAEDQLLFRGGRRYVPRIVRDASVRRAGVPIQPEGAYLITGGLGNLGLKTGEWLVRNGAKWLVLAGRTASTSQRIEAVAALRTLGARVDIVAADIGTAAGLEAIRTALAGARLRGVVHTAAVFDSTEISDLSAGRIEAVLAPKRAASPLLDLVAGSPLDFFVLFSSTTALAGVRSMAAYAAANAYLDSFAHQARRAGVPAIAVNWGTWDLMRGTSEQDRRQYLRTGLHPMPSAQALGALGDILGSGLSNAMIASIEWNAFKAAYEFRRRRPMFDLVTAAKPAGDTIVKPESGKNLRDLLEDVPPSARLDCVVETIRGEAARVLGLQTHEVDPAVGLFELGMDSLMSIELKRRLERRCGRSFPSTLTFNYPSVNALAAHIYDGIRPGLADAETPPIESEPAVVAVIPNAREELSEDQLADLLAQALDGIG